MWLIVALLFLLLELGHPGLFLFLSFSLGAVASAIVSYYSNSFIVQSLIFLSGTILSMVAMRRWLHSRPTKKHAHTNVYALRGKRGIITRTIQADQSGQVKVQGETWSARSVDGDVIEQGTSVEVVRVSGAHLVVQEV